MPPRKRKHDPTIPGHIDQSKIPTGVYWDRTGNGRWYVFDIETTARGPKKKRRTIAGRAVALSDLHAMMEEDASAGTIEWLSKLYHVSAKFKKLAKRTRGDYEYSRDVLLNIPATAGGRVGLLIVNRLRPHHIQTLIDRIDDEGTPTKAAKVLRYSRLLFRWGLLRGKIQTNPAQGLEAPVERKRQRLPASDAYAAMLAYARTKAAQKAHTKGSAPPYLPLVMDLGYMCRLRGIETITLTEAAADADGITTNRRKGSNDSFVEWSPRLRAVWDEALALRKKTIERTKVPEMIRPEDRYVFLAQGGEPLSKSGLDTAWQRLITAALKDGVITADQRFGLHDLKRRGGTDAPGHRGDRQDALGVSDAMMKVYDKGVPRVKPSA